MVHVKFTTNSKNEKIQKEQLSRNEFSKKVNEHIPIVTKATRASMQYRHIKGRESMNSINKYTYHNWDYGFTPWKYTTKEKTYTFRYIMVSD